MTQEIIQQAAALRGQGRHQDAISVVESNLSSLDEATRLPALLQAFYAAREANDLNKIQHFAQAIAVEDPNVPSIQSYLA